MKIKMCVYFNLKHMFVFFNLKPKKKYLKLKLNGKGLVCGSKYFINTS